MRNKGILKKVQLDATPHKADSLEVQLLKEEVLSLRKQLSEAEEKLDKFEDCSKQKKSELEAQEDVLLCFREMRSQFEAVQ